jgi:hypothetical protein
MTGGELAAVGKAIEAAGEQVLGEDQKTKEVLLRIAQGTPEMTAAARSLAARTAVKERVKLRLYEPFARMLGVSKAYFEDTFPLEMGAKIAGIPDENLITPPASIAVPALQGLSYSFNEGNLKDLYLNLLATASDDRLIGQAHPAFAEIIKQLVADEAQLLNEILKTDGINAVRLTDIFTATTPVPHLLPTVDDVTHEPKEYPQLPTWIDNWERLRLVRVTYMQPSSIAMRESHLAHGYNWVQERPEYVRLAGRTKDNALTIYPGAIKVTNFGRQFFRAVTE